MTTPSEQFRDREEASHAMSERIETEQRFGHPITGPQWYRREDMPEMPGLWVVFGSARTTSYQYSADIYSREDLARGAPFHCEWVYGPIPERSNG